MDVNGGRGDLNEERLVKARRWIVRWTTGFTVVIMVVWPAMSLSTGGFVVGYFKMWAVVAIVWGTVVSVHGHYHHAACGEPGNYLLGVRRHAHPQHAEDDDDK
ncbi:hypothetical protein PR202_ga03773 [Eleusine coracana subsp. coracana]|uniref:Uncharacterized protein n=1 Tax=Eleusine coracana subsp. coracana TaxID=191504 RepID=A0AAV5BN55_ELECO|nr:hypothetical protein PR202_ga03773 [Eleusine coracana subsp. coracana]